VAAGRSSAARRGKALRIVSRVDAGAAMDLPLRETLDVPHPPDLRPLLHAKQHLPPVSIDRPSQIKGQVGRTRPAPLWTAFTPAQADQYSDGVQSSPPHPVRGEDSTSRLGVDAATHLF
jgi:hypothetical protein